MLTPFRARPYQTATTLSKQVPNINCEHVLTEGSKPSPAAPSIHGQKMIPSENMALKKKVNIVELSPKSKIL